MTELPEFQVPLNTKPTQPEKDPGKDLKTFQQLPAKTQELLIVQEKAEKATGQASIDLQKDVRKISSRRKQDGPGIVIPPHS